MRQTIFSTWEADVYLDETARMYRRFGRARSDMCGCVYCRLYHRHRATALCPPCQEQLRKLNIDPAIDIGNSPLPTDREVLYLVQFHVAGRLQTPPPGRTYACGTCKARYWLYEARDTYEMMILDVMLSLPIDKELQDALRVNR